MNDFIGSIYQWKDPGPIAIYLTLTSYISLVMVDKEHISLDISEFKGHHYDFHKKDFVKIS